MLLFFTSFLIKENSIFDLMFSKEKNYLVGCFKIVYKNENSENMFGCLFKNIRKVKMCLVVIFRKFICCLLLCNKIYFLNFYYKFNKNKMQNELAKKCI